MRLVFIGPVHPFRGGIAQFTARLTEEMKSGNQCLVVSFTRLYPDFLFPGKSQFDANSVDLNFDSERILDPINPVTWIRACRRIADFKPDAVVFHYWHPFFAPAYLAIAAFLRHRSLRAAVCHNITPHENASAVRVITRLLFNSIDGFIVHAASEKIDLLSLKPDAKNIIAFHPLYDIFPNRELTREEARQRLGFDPSIKLALYFGLIRRYKGVDIFFKACRELSGIPGLKMLAVGEVYTDSRELDALVRTIPNGRAELIDRYIPNEEVALYFRAADVIVLPYRSATQSGVVPIAYACNRPVIVTDVGGLPEVVVDGVSGFIIPPEDPHALAEAVTKFFSIGDSQQFDKGIADMRRRLGWARYAELVNELFAGLKHDA